MTSKFKITSLILLITILASSFIIKEYMIHGYTIDELRAIYSSNDTSKWPAPHLHEDVAEGYVEIGNLPKVKHPKSNPYSRDKAELGKSLFFDPRLSESKQVSCASCHEPQVGWADGKRVAHGDFQQTGKRNTPTIINIGFATSLFWDGRASSLEDQAHGPIENPIEMNTKMETAVKNIQAIKGYRPLFIDAFGDDIINEERITKALATYQRTVKSTRSKFDLFIDGISNEYTDEEVLGLHLFRTKAKCVNCHNSPYFSDQKFHNLGLSYYGRFYEDLGLYNETDKKEDVGKFKTPTLREVSKTAPWMHNGLMMDLDGIMNMYNVGMPTLKRKEHQLKDTLFPTKSNLLDSLHLNRKERNAVEAFIKTLSSRTARIEVFLDLPKN